MRRLSTSLIILFLSLNFQSSVLSQPVLSYWANIDLLAKPHENARWDAPCDIMAKGLEMEPIFIGCDLEGCCPNCSPDSELKLHIYSSANEQTQVSLSLEGIGKEDSLTIKGDLKRVASNKFKVGPRGGIISGFKENQNKSVASAIVELKFPDEVAFDSSRVALVDLSIVQRVEDHIINRSTLFARISRCQPQPTRLMSIQRNQLFDHVEIHRNAGNSSSMVVDEYRSPLLLQLIPGFSPFRNDGLYNGDNSYDLFNQMRHVRRDLFVLNREKALYRGFPRWTVQPGDIHNVVLDERVALPVEVICYNRRFFLDPTIITSSTCGRYLRALVGFVSRIFASTGSGIDLDFSIKERNWHWSYKRHLQTSDPNKITIFLDLLPQTSRAVVGKNQVFIERFRGTTTLLIHELGHIFGLSPHGAGGHPNNPGIEYYCERCCEVYGEYCSDCDQDDFGADYLTDRHCDYLNLPGNYMNVNVNSRVTFSIGQLIRMNIAHNSFINELLDNRWHIKRNCGNAIVSSRSCPHLSLGSLGLPE